MANNPDDGAWFAPKRYGLGAGLPVRWQGWAVLLGFLAIVGAVGFGLEDKPVLQMAILVPLVFALLIITAFKTRGGWRWRWGDSE